MAATAQRIPEMTKLFAPQGHLVVKEVKKVLYKGWKWTKGVLDKHTDLISSAGILAISTCLLAAKIFKKMPSFLPKIANFIFNYGGIIWLNVQVRDFLKSCRDVGHAVREKDWVGLIETAAKVLVKGVNVLLTVVNFGAYLLTAVGLPHVSLSIYMALRPVSLGSLAINILSDIRDYFANRGLLKDLKKAEQLYTFEQTAHKVASCFMDIVIKGKAAKETKGTPERPLAYRIVRQVDAFTLHAITEKLKKDSVTDKVKLYESLKKSIEGTQNMTKGNLFLTVLGYVSMGVCKAFPESVIDKAVRWFMSLLYTAKLAWEKLFRNNIAKGVVLSQKAA